MTKQERDQIIEETIDQYEQNEYGYYEEKKEFYKVPVENMSLLENKIQKLNNKAAKLNFPAIELQIVGESENKRKEGKEVRVIKYKHVKVIGESPKLNGYRFVATIDHLTEGGNVIRAIDNSLVPEHFRSSKPYCEHCNTNRYRRDTYLVQHEDGAISQIGRNCLRDFLGHTDPEHYARYAEWLIDATDMATASEESREGGGSAKKFLETEEFLGFAAAIVLKHKFMSRSKARQIYENTERWVQTTSDRAIDAMFPEKYTAHRGNDVEITTEAEELRDAALQWLEAEIENNSNLSDYLHNLKTVCLNSLIEHRHAGIAASLFGAHHNAITPKSEITEGSKRLPASRHFGNIGDKIEVTVRCLKMIQIDGSFGTTYLHIMLDETTGIRFTWFCSNWKNIMYEGKLYSVKGTIKEHNEYEKTKQTVLTRCKCTLIDEEEQHNNG